MSVMSSVTNQRECYTILSFVISARTLHTDSNSSIGMTRLIVVRNLSNYLKLWLKNARSSTLANNKPLGYVYLESKYLIEELHISETTYRIVQEKMCSKG